MGLTKRRRGWTEDKTYLDANEIRRKSRRRGPGRNLSCDRWRDSEVEEGEEEQGRLERLTERVWS